MTKPIWAILLCYPSLLLGVDIIWLKENSKIPDGLFISLGVNPASWGEVGESGGTAIAVFHLNENRLAILRKDSFLDGWNKGAIPESTWKKTYGMLEPSSDGVDVKLIPVDSERSQWIYIEAGAVRRLYVLNTRVEGAGIAGTLYYFYSRF